MQSKRSEARGEWFFAALMTGLFIVFAAWTILHHEMWRDEFQAWLIARDSASPLDVVSNSRYDGHPVLWFIVLWPLVHLTHNPSAMQIANLVLAAGAVLLVARFAPFSRWIRTIACLGYFPVYEYGTLSRNYALGLLLLITCTALFQRRREHPLLMGVLLCLAAQTSLPACILVIAFIITLVTDEVGCPSERGQRLPSCVGICIAAVGVLLSVLQMRPPIDSGYSTDWNLALKLDDLASLLESAAAALLPLPHPGHGFWESRLLAELPGVSSWFWIVTPLFLGLSALSLLRKPVALVYFLAGCFGLLSFSYMKNLVSMRHYGFVFVCLGIALWIGRNLKPVLLSARLMWVSTWAALTMRIVLPLVFLVHMVGAGIALASERVLAFSGAKATAEIIRSLGLAHLPFVVERDYMGMGVLGYLDKKRVWYPAGSRWGSYIIWDTARFVTHGAWGEAVRLAVWMRSPVVVLLDAKAALEQPLPQELNPAVKLMAFRAGDVVTDETFRVFLLYPDRIPKVILDQVR